MISINRTVHRFVTPQKRIITQAPGAPAKKNKGLHYLDKFRDAYQIYTLNKTIANIRELIDVVENVCMLDLTNDEHVQILNVLMSKVIEFLDVHSTSSLEDEEVEVTHMLQETRALVVHVECDAQLKILIERELRGRM